MGSTKKDSKSNDEDGVKETLGRQFSRMFCYSAIRSGSSIRLHNTGLFGTHPRTIQMDKIAFDPSAATLVNVLTCDPSDQPKLLDLLRENIDNVIATLDGWRSTTLVAAPDGVRVIIISQWRDSASITSMQNDARMQAYFPKIAALAAFDSTPGVVSYTRHA